jgi:hypothetical protein
MSGVDIFGPINNNTGNSNEKLYSEEDEEKKDRATLIIILIFISLLILWYLYVFYNCLIIILFQGKPVHCDSNSSYNCNCCCSCSKSSKKINPETNNPPNKIKKVRLKEIPNDNINCAICMEDMTWYNAKSQLHCKHVFHKKCITKWYNKNKYDYTYTYLKKVECPLCRKEFIV